ncbi:MAG: HAMP domain-containing histidine kinase [Clostridia bacterium]|nr:HAMP domain-containing histidine kinase [Clostridia bacterium]
MDLVLLSTVLDPVSQAIVIIDSHSLVYANPAAKAVLGNDIITKPATELFAEEFIKCHAKTFACAAKIGDIHANMTITRDGDYQTIYIENISENHSMNITPQMMSYLRSCATGIKMSADRCFSLMDSRCSPAEKHISILYHYYYCLIRLVMQVNNAEKVRTGQFSLQTVSTNLTKLCFELTDTVSKLSSEKNISISFVCADDNIEAVVDPANIELMLLNLFSNSLKYTPSGGSITLTLSKTQENIVLSLDDTGKGIPEDKLAKLFSTESDEFDMTAPDPGLGLGLFISGSIVRLHNGVMLIESRDGEGTHIRIKLPAEAKPTLRFNTPVSSYRSSGVFPVLTELADVLKSDCYGPKYED